MRAITALCFVIAAVALLLLRRSGAPRKMALVMACGIAVSAVAAVTIIADLVELHTGTHWRLAGLPVVNLAFDAPFRMAIVTALLFFLFGLIIMLLGTGDRRAASSPTVALLSAILLTYLVFIGYLFKIPEFYEWRRVGVAINTDLAFAALILAAFAVRPDTRIIGIIAGSDGGAVLARRLLPVLIVLPLVIGWLRIQGERFHLFRSEAGVLLVATVYTICFLVLIGLTSKAFNRIDRRRRQGRRPPAGERAAVPQHV